MPGVASAWVMLHGHAEFLREPGHAVAAVAAGLRVAAQVGEAELAGASLQPPDAAVVDDKPALDDQLAGRFRWSGVTHALVVPGAPPLREPRHDQGINGPGAIGNGEPARMGNADKTTSAGRSRPQCRRRGAAGRSDPRVVVEPRRSLRDGDTWM
jgi:hypothetical protein